VAGLKRPQPTLTLLRVSARLRDLQLTEGFVIEQLTSVKQFCASHRISRSFFYKLVGDGRGPRITRIGTRTLISAEAAAAWRGQMQSPALGLAG
jgi:hypothetical protein